MDNYSIAWMCRQLGDARSSFYAWRARADTVTVTQARRDALTPEIQGSSHFFAAQVAAASSRPNSIKKALSARWDWSPI